MNTSRKSFFLLFLILLSFSTTLLWAQEDPGVADTVRIGDVSGDMSTDISVPVSVYNDEALHAIIVPVLVDGSSGWMRLDSISYVGSRLESTTILPERENDIFAADTFFYEAVLIRFSVSSGDPLPPGDGAIFTMWFSPRFGGEVTLDSLHFSPYGNLKLADESLTEFIPEFHSGTVDIACDYEIGDVRFDGGVNIGDYLGFFKQYFGCQEMLSPRHIADVNCDRHVDMRDCKAIFDHAFQIGDICVCGSYTPALYNDPGEPDTLWIESTTMFVGVEDTIDVRIVFDEIISDWSLALHWDGDAILNLSPEFNYSGGYLCADYEGNPGYVCPYTHGLFDDFAPTDTIIERIPFTPQTAGTATFTLGTLPTGPESMLVTAINEAVIPVVVGGIITVLPRPCGDANGDAEVNIGDAVYLINFAFKEGPAPDPLCLGDTNGDGDVNVGDAVYLINFVFKGGPPPVTTCCD